ncbi:LuxR C-terminal-related transcriptional regulator [Streptomyces sp. NPDC008092]|uniref:LuxR C-terminal-related transcriptional regulator n=1 Tax=Streptomyces sp. NPDC008092 TaxID=3364808 RepID=UPI0036E24B54
MPTVLIVNDQTLQRLGYRLLLQSQSGLSVIGEAAGGAEAERLATELAPDVVLLDNTVLTEESIETIRRIARLRPARPPSCSPASSAPAGNGAPRVLVLADADDDHACAALRAGAGGFLVKDAALTELTAAVRAVAAGHAVLSPRLTRRLVETVRGQLPVPAQSDRLQVLTERERDVLAALAHGRSTAEIAEQLSIAPTTVKSHVNNILAKIGAQARVQAVVFAYETGLVRPS